MPVALKKTLNYGKGNCRLGNDESSTFNAFLCLENLQAGDNVYGLHL